ncbi:MAG: hypothetical protein AAF899_16635 [Pseudomonadota bacterium]
MNDGGRISFPASRRKALVLLVLAVFVVLAFFGVDWFRWAESSVKWGAIVFGMGFAAYFLTFALALFFRNKPVFAVDDEAIEMPIGGMSLIRIPWSDVESYEIVKKGISLVPGIESQAFGVRLQPDARAREDWSETAVREFRLNRASMDVDVLLTHWFAPVGFDEVIAAARRFKPALERAHAA